MLKWIILERSLCLLMPSGTLEAWRVVYLQKQIPVASIPGICSHRNLSFPESLTNTASLLWNPVKSFPCYPSAHHGRTPSHLELVCDARHVALTKVCRQVGSLLYTSSE